MMRMFFVLLLCLIFIQTHESDAAERDALALVRDNVRHFRMLNVSARRNGSSSAESFELFLNKLQEGKADFNSQEKLDAFYQIVSLAMEQHVFHRHTGFVHDEITVKIVVSALKDSDREISDFAVRTLTSNVLQRDLDRNGTKIKRALGLDARFNGVRLLAKLPLKADETKRLLERKNLWPEIKARLGDSKAERKLIENFKKVDEYGKMAELARQLGYIGSPDCARALLEALNSTVKLSNRRRERSIRCELLSALGQIYQEEALFTRDVIIIIEQPDSNFERLRGLDQYVEDVNAWAKKRFGLQVWSKEKVWFKKTFNVPIGQ